MSIATALYQYQKAKQIILALIEDHPADVALPNRNQLARLCDVSRVSLERAISELIGEGHLVSRDGSGTYVVARQPGVSSRPPSPARPRTWAFMVSSIVKDYYPAMLRSVEDIANTNQISLILCNTDNDLQKQDEYLFKMVEQGVTGIIIVPAAPMIKDFSAFDAVQNAGIHLVTCTRQVPGRDYPGVYFNFFQSGYLATEHLIEQGCKHIAYLSPSRYTIVMDRMQGYLAALSNYGMAGNSLICNRAEHGDLSEVSDAVFLRFFEDHPEIDGVFAFNDRLSISLYRVLEKLGKKAGRDIRVVSCDNSAVCGSLPVPLSSMQFDTDEMGRIAAEFLLRLEKGDSPETLPYTVLGTTLIQRQSSQSQG